MYSKKEPCRGVVGRIPAFEPGGVTNINFYYGTGCVSLFRVLSCVVAVSVLDILLSTDFRDARFCVLVQSLCSPYRYLTHGRVIGPGGRKFYSGEDK